MSTSRPALPSPDVLDALEGFTGGLLEQTAYRVLVLRRGQDRATRADFLRENTLGARWNPAGVAAIYASLEPETAGAEGAFLAALNGPTSRFQIGQLDVRLEQVVDLSSEERLQDVGLSRTAVSVPRHEACRLIGGACDWLGVSGLLVPSARRWPSTNLVVLTGNLGPHTVVEPAGEPMEWTDA